MRPAREWQLYAFAPFAARLIALKAEVEGLRDRDPKGYRHHPAAILLASVHKAITEVVPSDPDRRDFRVGHSLGASNAHWRRVKRGLPARYRLFYRFSTRPAPMIVYAWLNDESTLRKAGAKTDVYAVFQKMLARGEVPADIEDLKRRSAPVRSRT